MLRWKTLLKLLYQNQIRGNSVNILFTLNNNVLNYSNMTTLLYQNCKTVVNFAL